MMLYKLAHEHVSESVTRGFDLLYKPSCFRFCI